MNNKRKHLVYEQRIIIEQFIKKYSTLAVTKILGKEAS